MCRYLDNPLLVGGKKFDLRVYVLVTSYKPLKVYVHRQGFCRFCTVRYTPINESPDDMFVHLTNVSFQKQSATYNDVHGGKWTLENLRLYIEGTRGRAAVEKLFDDMNWVFLHTLKAMQGVIINDRHCFELYGFDILIDNALKPWLIEVNASPSLSATTVADRLLKASVIHDVLNIVFPNGEMSDVRSARVAADAPADAGPSAPSAVAPAGTAGAASAAAAATGAAGAAAAAAAAPPPSSVAGPSLGGFELLFDESVALEAEKAEKRAKAKKPTLWR